MCFLFGKINSEISFDFLINHKKHISIASCFILSEEGNEITNDGVDMIRIYEY